MIGLDLFASTFAGLEEQYVLIGGAAAELWFQRAGLELFAVAPFELPEGGAIFPIDMNAHASSLSAVLLAEAYWVVVMTCRRRVAGITCLTPWGWVLPETRACLELTDRDRSGSGGHSDHIEKYHNDVFRNALPPPRGGEDPEVPDAALEDLAHFPEAIEGRPDPLTAIGEAGESLPLSETSELPGILHSRFRLDSSRS